MSNKIHIIGQKHQDRQKVKEDHEFLKKLSNDTALLEMVARYHAVRKVVYGPRWKVWFRRVWHGRDLAKEFEALRNNKPKYMAMQDELAMLQSLAARKITLRRLAGGRIREFLMVTLFGRDPYVDPFLNIKIIRYGEKSEDAVPGGSGDKKHPSTS